MKMFLVMPCLIFINKIRDIFARNKLLSCIKWQGEGLGNEAKTTFLLLHNYEMTNGISRKDSNIGGRGGCGGPAWWGGAW